MNEKINKINLPSPRGRGVGGEGKIAIIVSTFPPYKGGMGNSAYEIAKILSKYGHEITVFCPQHNIKEELQDEPFAIERIKPWLQLGQGALLLQLFSKLSAQGGSASGGKKFDVIYLHYPFFGGAEVVWLFKLLHPKTRLVIHYHMDTPGFGLVKNILSLPSQLIRNNLFKHADKIICSSLDYVQHSDIADFYYQFPEKFVGIPFGVDIDKFKVLPRQEVQKLRSKHNIKDKEKVILFVGGLDKAHYFKGVDILIRAVSDIRYQISDVKLIIIGDGDMRGEYERQVRELGIGDSAIFCGRISDKELPLYYNLADVFVLPSIDKSEAFGIVLLEAMACGTSVIASDLPGVRTVFRDREQGLFCRPGDANDLKNKLEQVLNNDRLRIRMGQAARRLVEEKYDWGVGLSRCKNGVGKRVEEVFNPTNLQISYK